MDTVKNLFNSPFKTLLLGGGGTLVSAYVVGLFNPVTYGVVVLAALLVYRAHTR